MPLSGLDHRFNARSYAEDQADMQGRYAGEICDGQGDRSRTDRIHNPEQTQAPRDIAEDGAEDSRSLEDGSGQISALGGADLHEARSMMDKRIWITTIILLAVILIGNIGGLWLIGAI